MSQANPMHTLSDSEQRRIASQKVPEKHTVTDMTIASATVNGNLGEYFHVEMTIEEENGKALKHRFFMKALPSDRWKTDFLVNEGIFHKEINFYENFSGLIREYLSADVCPRCFLATPGKIVLADATQAGYRPWRGITKEPLDYDHTKLGLMALARLHAGSLIYEEKTGRKVGDDFPDLAREVVSSPGSLGIDFFKTGGAAIAALAPRLDTDLGKDPEAVALLQEHVVPWFTKHEHYMCEDAPYRQVICHGDAWPANFLYKYDDQGKPLSAIMVDFQLTRLRSPAVDVNMFLSLSTFTDNLKKWRESLLDAYYQVIREEMANCGLDSNKIYPEQDFLEAYIYYQIVGPIYTMLYFPFAFIPLEVKNEATADENGGDFYYKDRSQHLIKWYKEYPMLRNSLNGAIDLFYHNFIKTKRGLTEFVT